MGVIRPTGESSWGQSGWQGSSQALIRLAEEVLEGDQAGRQVSCWEPAVPDCERDVPPQGSGLNQQSDIPRGVPDWRGWRLG